jgi:uncharacterized repeat protein (TIGR01451 family)
MQRFFVTSTVTLLTTILCGAGLPVISHLTVPAFAQSAAPVAKQPIQLKLSQAKKTYDSETKKVKLLPIRVAKPGDVIVYTITASNIVDRPIKKLVINQKIRPGTVYVLNSATPLKGTELSFSIDGGKTYTPQPTINKKPAPAESYTNVRWAFGSVAPKSNSSVSYEIRVR